MAMIRSAARFPPLYCRLLLTRTLTYPFVVDLTKDHLSEREHSLENMYFWQKERQLLEKLAKQAGSQTVPGIPPIVTMPNAAPFLGLDNEELRAAMG